MVKAIKLLVTSCYIFLTINIFQIIENDCFVSIIWILAYRIILQKSMPVRVLSFGILHATCKASNQLKIKTHENFTNNIYRHHFNCFY